MTQRSDVVVTGASGDVGSALVDLLVERGAPPRALVRRQEVATALGERGVETVLGDLGDDRAVGRALTGCRQLVLVLPASRDQLAMETRVVDAAVRSGVEHVVKVSTADANPASAIPWARDLARGDERLRHTGMRWTRLQPAAFMKNLLTEAGAIRRGFLPQTSGHGATAWIDAPDISAAIDRILVEDRLQGGAGDDGVSYRLTGTPATSYVQIARMLSQRLDRRVRYVQVPAPAMYALLRLAGTEHWQAKGLVDQFLVVRRGEDGVRLTSPSLRELIGREPTSLEEYVDAHREELLGRGA